MNVRYNKLRENILDTAERLFAENGYYHSTMRDISRDAKIRPVDVTDVFETKEDLFYEVIKRRATEINLIRIDRISTVISSGDRSDQLRQILRAFYSPLYEKSVQDERWLNYLRLVPQIMRKKSPILILVTEFYTPISAIFLKRLKVLYPETSFEKITSYWHFALVTYFNVFLDDFRIGELQMDGFPTVKNSSIKERFQDAEDFIIAGFETLIQQ